MNAQKGRQATKGIFTQKDNGPQMWEGTVPLLLAPDNAIQGIARALVRIANGKQKWFEFGHHLPGGGAMQGRVDVDSGNRGMFMRWLKSLPEPPAGVLDEIVEYLGEIEVRQPSVVVRSDDGQVNFGLNVAMRAPTNNATLAYMVGLILSAGYADNIRRCPQCGKWFFDIPKGRRMKRFCSDAHANAYRQAKHREKKAKGKSK